MANTPVFVPYQQKGEPKRRAGIIKVKVPLADLTENQLQLMGHLNRAADEMNHIFVQQCFRDTPQIAVFLQKIRPFLTTEEQKRLDEYNTVLHLQNGPWTDVPRKNHQLQVLYQSVEAAARQAGETHRLNRFQAYLFDAVEFPKRVEFYPEDMTEAQLQALGPEGTKVNTVVRREQDSFAVLRNEELFQAACRRAAAHLAEARKWAEDPEFSLYLDAKIEELHTRFMSI